MRYHVLVGDAHHEVDVQPAPDGTLLVSLGEAAHRVDVSVLVDGAAYSLIVDGRSVDVSVEESGDEIDLLIGGSRYPTEVLGEREWIARSIKGEGDEGDREVRATMTGIVREVLVAPGDAVTRGQTLLILEAMKMENEVKAEADGTVGRVSVEVGATVSQGDLLAEID